MKWRYLDSRTWSFRRYAVLMALSVPLFAYASHLQDKSGSDPDPLVVFLVLLMFVVLYAVMSQVARTESVQSAPSIEIKFRPKKAASDNFDRYGAISRGINDDFIEPVSLEQTRDVHKVIEQLHTLSAQLRRRGNHVDADRFLAQSRVLESKLRANGVSSRADADELRKLRKELVDLHTLAAQLDARGNPVDAARFRGQAQVIDSKLRSMGA